MKTYDIEYCIDIADEHMPNASNVIGARDELSAMQVRIDELELERIGTNRLLQAIADELGCEPNSDILAALAKSEEQNPYLLSGKELQRIEAMKRAA